MGGQTFGMLIRLPHRMRSRRVISTRMLPPIDPIWDLERRQIPSSPEVGRCDRAEAQQGLISHPLKLTACRQLGHIELAKYSAPFRRLGREPHDKANRGRAAFLGPALRDPRALRAPPRRLVVAP